MEDRHKCLRINLGGTDTAQTIDLGGLRAVNLLNDAEYTGTVEIEANDVLILERL